MNGYEAVLAEEERRRRVNEAVMQRALQPTGTQMVSGRAVPYHPMQGLSQIGQAIIARSAMERGERRIREAREAEEARRQAASQEIIETAMGRPAQPAVTAPLLGPEEFGEGVQEITPAVPEVAPDPRRAALMAASRPETAGMARVIGAMGQQERGGYFTPEQVVTPEGRIVTRILNRRTGELIPVSPTEPISPKDPLARAAVKGAEKTAEFEAKRTFGMAGIGETIDEARNILTTGEPTGSGIGKAIDWMGRQAGVTTKSAQQAAQLEAIGGALTAKMPRMEGPQSDFDRQMYEQMAAKVGDRGVPTEERLAALESMENIWRKYEHLNPEERKETKPAYVETRTLKDGRVLGKKADGTIEEIR